MRRYEVWAVKGGAAERVSDHADRTIAQKALRGVAARGPGAVTLGADVLAFTADVPKAAEKLLRDAVAAAHAGEAKIEVPKPPENAVHRTPLRTRLPLARPAVSDDEDEEPEAEADAPAGNDEADDHDDETTTAPEEPMRSKPDPSLAPSCAVLGCRELVPIVRADTVPELAGCCRFHRGAGREAVSRGRTTLANVVAYLSEGPHPNTRSATAARRERRSEKPPTPRATKAPPTPAARPAPAAAKVATAASGAVIHLTLELPVEHVAARAIRCESLVGIEALEALATLRSDSSITDVVAVLALLPARGER